MAETDSESAANRESNGRAEGRVLEPETAAELAAILREASLAEQAVVPRGGGVHTALGNPLTRPAVTLSTARLAGMIEYQPADLVVSVRAGTRFADLQQILAEHGQWLPVEAPDDDRATIGGLLATALTGPRQLGSGSLRDLLIGISTALPDGTVAKAGGMVVKNVTGFDMARLHYGALGTLGVITSANFKVLPKPKGERTVVFDPDRSAADGRVALRQVLELSTTLRRSNLLPVAQEVFRNDGRWALAVRFEGRPETFGKTTDRIVALLRHEPSEIRDEEASSSWWRSYLARESLLTNGAEALIAIHTRPHEMAEIAEQALFETDWRGAHLESVAISPGLGRMRVRFGWSGADPGPHFAAVIESLRWFAPRTTVLAAPEPWTQAMDVWGEPDNSISVMRALRDQFDPNRVLNPGRFLRGV